MIFPYTVQAPANHRVSFWIEVWNKGLRTEIPGFNINEWRAPGRGSQFKGSARLELADRQPAGRGQKGLLRWNWIVRQRSSTSRRSGACEDPLEGMVVTDTTWGQVREWKPKPGDVVTLLRVRGARDQLLGPATDARMAREADVAIELKARIDPVPESRLSRSPTSGSLPAPGTEPATPEVEAR